jgi:muconolactone delta-isomerase
MEYLVTMTTRVPEGTSAEAVADVRAREAAHTRELAAQGRVLRLWRPPLAPGEWRSLGLFSAEDPDDLERTLASMPLRVWRTDEVTPLDPHPNDPGRAPAPDRALAGQRVVVLGGSSGIGLETARTARACGAEVVLVGRDAERLGQAAQDVGAERSAAFDVADAVQLAAFFRSLPGPVDHVLLTAGGPIYGALADLDIDEAGRHVAAEFAMVLHLARLAPSAVRAGGSLLLLAGTGSRRPAIGISVAAALTAALPALTANLALELAPIRVNLLAPGFVDTPLSASLLGDALEERRAQLRATLPIRRVIGPGDVAALAVHVMANTALTGATFDVDGGQQLM